jgi:hypothetical protein
MEARSIGRRVRALEAKRGKGKAQERVIWLEMHLTPEEKERFLAEETERLGPGTPIVVVDICNPAHEEQREAGDGEPRH